MHQINWLRSPSVVASLTRYITQYRRFFKIIKENPTRMVVPTLSVDLVWHTHQLSPQSYYQYSNQMTNRVVDHDDKIEESKLDDSFAWTSKAHEQEYKEPYSECLCWYCEAIRESRVLSLRGKEIAPPAHSPTQSFQICWAARMLGFP
jgi:hypothetical protein